MTEHAGWERVSCAERDALVDRLGRSYNGFSLESGVRPIGSLTDLAGRFGTPVVRTTWGREDGALVLLDVRWPYSDKPCEHYVPAGARLAEVSR